jgi:hypothetical protein
MIDPGIERELVHLLRDLPADQQRRVLDFARALVSTNPRGQQRPAPPGGASNEAEEEAHRKAAAASDDRADLLDW